MTAQDQARLRNILVRRYVEPEPVIVLGTQELFASPELTGFKTGVTVSDPVNGVSNPFAIPGAIVEYEIRVVNGGAGTVDLDSLIITDALPAQLQLLVIDTAPGSGPVQFIDGPGSSASGLNLSFGGLNSTTDDIDFSIDGVDYTYVPVADANGGDPAVTFLRINPGGAMQPASGGGETFFSVRYRMRVP